MNEQKYGIFYLQFSLSEKYEAKLKENNIIKTNSQQFRNMIFYYYAIQASFVHKFKILLGTHSIEIPQWNWKDKKKITIKLRK